MRVNRERRSNNVSGVHNLYVYFIILFLTCSEFSVTVLMIIFISFVLHDWQFLFIFLLV